MSETFYTSHILIKSDNITQTADGKLIISGAVASLGEDYDGEVLEKSGVLNGLKHYWKMGRHVDVDHKFQQSEDWGDIVGKAIEIIDVKGVPHLVAELFPSKPKAKAVWDHIQSGGEAGFSIFGKALKRDPKDPKRILDTEIHMVTIALSPKGFDARARVGRPEVFSPLMMAKAIMQKAGMPMGQALPPSPDPSAMPPQGMPPEQGGGGEPPPPTKQEVNYRPGEGDSVCANCAIFQQGTCLLLQDTVRPMDSCDAFHPMEDEAASPQSPDPSAMPPQGAPQGMPPVMGKAMPQLTKAHSDCAKCGTKMYCLKCHRDSKSSVKKAAPPAIVTDSCPRCGNQLSPEEQESGYCEKCDEAVAESRQEDVVDKAYTTGEGVVQPGESSPAALRKQYLREGGHLRKKKPGVAVKTRTDDEEEDEKKKTAKSLLVQQIQQKLGSKDADRLAEQIIAKARKHWLTQARRR